MTTGKSLHIGLNRVSPDHYGGWSGPLTACEADAEDMATIAVQQGFQPKRLMTTQATFAAVRAQLDDAAKQLKAGDTFLLSYSGHGGQLPDQDDEEDDRLDETWCLFDGQLIDDELYAQFAKFAAGVRIIVLSDSCHSGSVIKSAFYRGSLSDRAAESVTPAVAVRAMPNEVAQRTYRLNKGSYDTRLADKALQNARQSIQATAVLISGCMDNQLSADGPFNGLFTATLLQVWGNGEFLSRQRNTHRHLWKSIVRLMPPDQTPNYFVVGAQNADFSKAPALSVS